MATRSFVDKQYVLIKRQVTLYTAVSCPGGTGAVTPQKWVYPTLGAGPNARTYQAAPAATALPSGVPYPLQYTSGAEGIRSVARTGVGLWTFTTQDNYQRLVQVSWVQQLAGGVGDIIAVGRNTTPDSFAAQGGSVFGISLMSATATVKDPVASTILFTFVFADGTEP